MGNTDEDIYSNPWDTSVTVVTYSNIGGTGYTGEGNISADPQFVDAANGD